MIALRTILPGRCEGIIAKIIKGGNRNCRSELFIVYICPTVEIREAEHASEKFPVSRQWAVR
jgi:hypothetical protein